MRTRREIIVGAAVMLLAACSGGGGAADAGGGHSGGGDAVGRGGSSGSGGTSGAGGSSGSGGSSGAGGVSGSTGAAGSFTCGSIGGGGAAGTTGAGGTSLQFTMVGPAADFRSVACGVDVCYAVHLDTASAQYRFVDRLANTATVPEDFSTGLGAGPVGTLLIDGADNLTVTQYGAGVLMRAATAPSFVMVGDSVPTSATGRQALARGPDGTLFVGTTIGAVVLSPGGSTFATLGSGITFAYAVVTDGANLFAASNSVKVLPCASATWANAGSNSPTNVNALALDRAGNLYAVSTATSLQGIYRLPAGGSTWQFVNGNLSQASVAYGLMTNIVFDAQNNAYLMIESGGSAFGSTFLMKLAPGGTSWGAVSATGLPIGDMSCRWLAIDALGRFVAACSDGLLRSSPLY